MQRIKAIRFFGNTASTTGETLSMPSGSDFPEIVQAFRYMDVVINVKTLGGGTSPSLAFSIQEKFSDVFVQTASATGSSVAKQIVLNSASGNGGLGKGEQKQIVVTVSGSPTAVSADVYLVLFN
ncbi:MAG: hypothetical protein M1275_03290 [Patescibacteria group bacterium]|nr:hypothetical protein [Patescibacteria group bacterium]